MKASVLLKRLEAAIIKYGDMDIEMSLEYTNAKDITTQFAAMAGGTAIASSSVTYERYFVILSEGHD